MEQGPSCWIVTDGAAGNVKQCEALADAIGAPAETFTLGLRRPWETLVPYWRGLGTRGIRGNLASRLRAPWPELLLTAGRRAVLASTTIGRLAGGAVWRVHLMDPRISPRHFDRVVCPRHDRCRGTNVTRTRGSLHAVTADALAAWRTEWAEALGGLLAPRVALLIGAGTRSVPLARAALDALADAAVRAAGSDGTLLVTASRRSPPELSAWLRERLGEAVGERARFAESFDRNPYAGFLAWADHVVVSPDSVNMVSEALGTGRPVYTVFPEDARGRPARFLAGLRDDGLLLPASRAPCSIDYEPLREAATVAEIVASDLASRAR